MKKLTPKTNMTIANLVMGAGVIYNLVDMILFGMDTFRWIPMVISIVVVGAGYAWRLTMVKCPHCGDKFKGIHNKLPDRCPNCNGRLDKMPE